MVKYNEKTHERRVRRKAAKIGWSVHKSRDILIHSNNYGEYMLANENNCLELGPKFDADLTQIETALDEETHC